MPPRRKNCVSDFVRKTYPGLDLDNFETFHRIVSKLRSRAKARGFDPSNLTQEQFDFINSDDLLALEKGEKFLLSWEDSSMRKGMVEEAMEYLIPKQIGNYKVEDRENLTDYMIVPSAVKLAARGLKEENNFLLQASHLSPIQIDLVKNKLQSQLANFIIKNVEGVFVNEI